MLLIRLTVTEPLSATPLDTLPPAAKPPTMDASSAKSRSVEPVDVTVESLTSAWVAFSMELTDEAAPMLAVEE